MGISSAAPCRSSKSLALTCAEPKSRLPHLNETLFASLAQARAALERWRADYNNSRPHSKLGWKTPTEFATMFPPRRGSALRNMHSSAPIPAAQPARQGESNRWSELKSG